LLEDKLAEKKQRRKSMFVDDGEEDEHERLKP